MESQLYRNVSLLANRAVIAFIFLWHGVPKAIDWPFAFDKFVGFGLPGVLGPITGVVEVIASVLLVVGLLHRWAAISLAVVIVGALATVQIPGGFSPSTERDLLILAGTLTLMTIGPGKLAVDRSSR